MKVFSAEQVRAWDEYTIREEPILSIDLMERAAKACIDWITHHYPKATHFDIFCGKGNNGGDGLAMARLLADQGKQVHVFVLEFGYLGTDDFQKNLARLQQNPQVQVQFVQQEEHLRPVDPGSIIIDAIFGTGLNRGLEGLAAALVSHINHAELPVISIDMPSGLFSDRSSGSNPIVRATYTITFQCLKPALLYPENNVFTGEISVLDIALHPKYLLENVATFEFLEKSDLQKLLKKRSPVSHKGNYGHALLLAGAEGKMGAATLAAKGALRSGLGLLTCQIPRCGHSILQVSIPEAMVSLDKNDTALSGIYTDLTQFDTIGIGPGIGQSDLTSSFLSHLLQIYNRPMVIDADALNIIASNPSLLTEIPKDSILTPHLKEFERLFGKCQHDQERIHLAQRKAKELGLVIVLKGHHTLITNPSDQHYFNSTGNAGMATGGSGDVLTGIITGLLSQGYSSLHAALIGVYLHGKAGDLAISAISQEALIATDLLDYLGKAWLSFADC